MRKIIFSTVIIASLLSSAVALGDICTSAGNTITCQANVSQTDWYVGKDGSSDNVVACSYEGGNWVSVGNQLYDGHTQLKIMGHHYSETITVARATGNPCNLVQFPISWFALNPSATQGIGIWSGSGNDTVKGYTRAEYVDGGEGNDYIFGNNGDDILHGNGGTDRIFGQGGDDEIWGENDADYLYGNDGDDRINGGYGLDFLYGNSGGDTCHGGYGFIYLGTGNTCVCEAETNCQF